MPDGNSVSIDQSILNSADILFESGLLGGNQFPLSNLLLKSIEQLDVDLKKMCLKNIVLSGGNS